MKETTTFEFATDEFVDYDWLFAPQSSEDEDDVFPVSENLKEAAKRFNVSEEFLKEVNSTFQLLANEIISAVQKDMKDLYEKIEALEE